MPHISKRATCSLALAIGAFGLGSGIAHAQQVFTSDVIVQGSLCVGLDCATSESFGFDTLVLKENNLRMFFNDTSSSGSFPQNDWRLVANESDNGGANLFAVEDATAGRQPFIVEAGARANALVVSDNDRIGVGLADPVLNVHVRDGNSPALRLDQDGSDGFASQAWDLAGNETNFFVRDVTNASKLPFKIFPDADTNSLVVTDREIGINIQDPAETLHVRDTDGTTQLYIQDTGGSGPQQLLRLENDGAVQLYMNNTSKASAQWMFSAGQNMLLVPGTSPGSAVFDLSNTGNLAIDGTLTQSSDKNRKMAIEPVDPQEILAKVSSIPVAEWTYKHDAETGIRHIGPMAQDFYAAFGTGATETGISALDGTGVALAAIQALSAENAALRARLDVLEANLGAQ